MIKEVRERGVICDGMSGMCDGVKPWRKKEGRKETGREWKGPPLPVEVEDSMTEF